MNIVFAISEVEELVKTGGLADVGKALPLALHALGEDITIVMPYYRVLDEQLNLATVTEPQTLFTEGQVYHFNIRYLQWHDIPIYFVDSPEHFMREDSMLTHLMHTTITESDLVFSAVQFYKR